MNMRLFCNSFADWCRLAKIHWTLMNKIKGPQLFSLYATKVWEEFDIISHHTYTHKLTTQIHSYSKAQLVKKMKKKKAQSFKFYTTSSQDKIFIKRQGCKKLQSDLTADIFTHTYIHLNYASSSVYYTCFSNIAQHRCYRLCCIYLFYSNLLL